MNGLDSVAETSSRDLFSEPLSFAAEEIAMGSATELGAAGDAQQKKWGSRSYDESITWDAFLPAWERALLLRSFIWTQECGEEKKLFKQFSIRLKRLFNSDFCLIALSESSAKLVSAGFPESTADSLPPHFVRRTLDLIAGSRVPLSWNQPSKEFSFRHVVVAPVAAELGKPVGFIMLAQAQPRSFSQADLFILQTLAGELSWALREMQVKQRQERLVTSVTEELQSCLSAISADCDKLAQQVKPLTDTEEPAELNHIRHVNQEVHRLMHTLAANLPREAGALSLGDEIDLPTMLEEVFAAARDRAQAEKIVLAITRAADLPADISTDGLRLKQVVRNLLNHAIEFHAGSIVQVAVRRKAEFLEVAVSGLRRNGVSEANGSARPKMLDLIKEQLEYLAGHIHIGGGSGQPHEITVCVPCL
jgi:signal transduction histidine kinase